MSSLKMKDCIIDILAKWFPFILVIFLLGNTLDLAAQPTSEGAGLPSEEPLVRSSISSSLFVDALGTSDLPSYPTESMSVAWFDWNRDGWIDLWIGNHGDIFPGQLYLNQQDGTFTEDLIPDITSPYKEESDHHGAAWSDLDNDGDPDLVVQVGAEWGGDGRGRNRVFESQNVQLEGTRELVQRTGETGIEYPLGRGRMPLTVDYDRDGKLDILLNNVKRPDGKSAPPRLFLQTRTPPAFQFEAAREEGVSLAHSRFAQTVDLTGDTVSEIIPAKRYFPSAMYDPTTRPFTDLTGQLLSERAIPVYDVAVADFNGDLQSDLFLCRRGVASGAATARDSLLALKLRAAPNRGNSLPSQSGAKITTTGDIRLRSFRESRDIFESDHIFIGEEGHHPSSGRDLELLADTTAYHGLVDPDTLDVNRALLIGRDSTEGTWSVKAVAFGQYVQRGVVISTTTPMMDIEYLGRFNEAVRPQLYLSEPGQTELNLRPVDVEGFDCTNSAPGDFDNDGDVDIYLANGGALKNEANALLENDGNGNFQVVPSAGGAIDSETTVDNANVLLVKGRAVVGDYNRDGFLDIYTPGGDPVTALGEVVQTKDGEGAFPAKQPHLFKNRGAEILGREDHHYVSIELTGEDSNRDAIGARVYLYADSMAQVRTLGGGFRHFAQDSKILHFGLGHKSQVDSLVVHWPNGRIRRWAGLEADRRYTLNEEKNPPPAVRSDTAIVEGMESVEVAVLANDTDPNDDSLSIESATSPSSGQRVIVNGRTIRYRPEPGFQGRDHVTYTVRDDEGAANRGQLVLKVTPPPPTALTLDQEAGWNLIGLPFQPEGGPQSLFSESTIDAPLLQFDRGYAPVTELSSGMGYWLNARSSSTHTLKRVPKQAVRISLREGWNLFAGPNCNLPITSIPDSSDLLRPETLFGYDGGYKPRDVLRPGEGYWIKAREKGEITAACIPDEPLQQTTEETSSTQNLGQLLIRDAAQHTQALYLQDGTNESIPTSSELPPTPPEGAFDARFDSNGRILKSKSGLIRMQGVQSPVHITLASPSASAVQAYTIEVLRRGKADETFTLQQGKDVLIRGESTVRLRLQAASERPEKFALKGNVPNPFRDQTALLLNVPRTANVSVEIYDTIGRRVLRKLEQFVYSGKGRRMRIEVPHLAPGIYPYRVRAEMGSTVEVRKGKMVIVR
jgi:hypothetical protein